MSRDHDVDAGWRPFTAETAAGFDPGSSAGTIRPRQRQLSNSSSNGNGSNGFVTQLARQHASGAYTLGLGGSGRQWESESRGSAYRSHGCNTSSGNGSGNGSGSSGSEYSDRQGGVSRGGGRRGRDDSRDERDRSRSGGGGRNRGQSISSATSTSSESESESDTDDYGQESSDPTTTQSTECHPRRVSVLGRNQVIYCYCCVTARK